MKTLHFAIIIGVSLLLTFCTKAQNAVFSGTFSNSEGSIVLRFKPVGAEYHGVLQTSGVNFALQGKVKGKKMTGTIYGAIGPVAWQLVKYEGQPAVFMAFRDGTTSVNPINKQRILEGRWRVGNTQYAVQRNKVRCN